jgi:hypothetical protein
MAVPSLNVTSTKNPDWRGDCEQFRIARKPKVVSMRFGEFPRRIATLFSFCLAMRYGAGVSYALFNPIHPTTSCWKREDPLGPAKRNYAMSSLARIACRIGELSTFENG